MFKQIVLAGSAAAVVLGAGTAALAASGSTPAAAPNGTASSQPAAPNSAAASKGHKAGKAARAAKGPLRNALHAQWVTRAGKGATGFVTHDAIRGEVTAVSATSTSTSITVKATDNVSQTYTVTSATKVHTRADAKGKAGTISEVHSGDRVAVFGTGTSTLTAVHIADGTKK